VADADAHVLVEPTPSIQYVGIVDGGVEVQLSAWCRNEIFFETRARFALELLAALERDGIEVIGSRRDVRIEGDNVSATAARGGA
jgi:hypothetical protein